MWKPNYPKTQTFISRWLERKRQVRTDMEDTQFHWKQIHHITKSLKPLGPDQMTKENIPKNSKTVYPKELSVEIRLLSTKEGKAEIYIYSARKDDSVVLVASGMVKTGPQTEIRDNKLCYFADKIYLDKFWFTKILKAQHPARIMFNTHGYHRVFAIMSFTNDAQWYVDMVGADKCQ